MQDPRLPKSTAHPSQQVYRPTYRPRTPNPSYELENTGVAKPIESQGLFKPLEALEEWSKNEGSKNGEPTDVRWHPEKRILRIFVDSPPSAGWASLVQIVSKSWEAASQGRLHFMSTPRPEEADIIIEWSKDQTFGRKYEVGHCDREIQLPCWIRKAHVKLVVEPEIERHLSPAKIKSFRIAALLHEMGHALGLEHSQSDKDVMHHRGWKNDRLTVNDLKRFHTLYTKPIPTQFII